MTNRHWENGPTNDYEDYIYHGITDEGIDYTEQQVKFYSPILARLAHRIIGIIIKIDRILA